MGKTLSAPFKEKFFIRARHFFAALLCVTQEKITQLWWKRALEGAMFSYEDAAYGHALCFI